MELDGREIVDQIPPFFYIYKDGSVDRYPPHPPVPPSLRSLSGVASKDIALDTAPGLWARIFLPPHQPTQKLPIVLYFHGGSFVFGSPAHRSIHAFCTDIARCSHSIWVSCSYRLAPEHRLPAAYEDGFAAVCWLLSQARRRAGGERVDPWLAKADFSRCFLAGESAGADIVHHAAIRASQELYFDALRMRGLMLIHPGFFREARTQAEMECPQNEQMSWSVCDKCLGWALPEGANLDHPFLNPLSREAPNLKDFQLPKVLVALADTDPLHYMGLEYYQAMRAAGHDVELLMSEGEGHVFYKVKPDSKQTRKFMEGLAAFMIKS